MIRVEFLKRLEYLLQDVDEKEREDILAYYNDYLDEAGLSDKDSVDGILDAPEKIAASIRSSMNSSDDEKIQFSEDGFRDISMEQEEKVPDVYSGEKKEEHRESPWRDYSEDGHTHHEPPEVKNDGKLGKIILIGILCVLALPMLLGLGGAALGLSFGILGTIFGVLCALIFGSAGCTIGGLVGGIALFVMSIIKMTVSVPQGLLMMGISFLMLAAGIICLLITIVIFTRLLPWIIRSIVNVFRRLFHRKEGGEA